MNSSSIDEVMMMIKKLTILCCIFILLFSSSLAELGTYDPNLYLIPLNDIEDAAQTAVAESLGHSSSGKEYTLNTALYIELEGRKVYQTITTHPLADAYETALNDLVEWQGLSSEAIANFTVVYVTRPAVPNIRENPYWEIILVQSLEPLHGIRYCIDDITLEIFERNEFF